MPVCLHASADGAFVLWPGMLFRVPNSLMLDNICYIISSKAEVRRSFITTNVREQRPRSHHNLKGATGRV